MMKAIYSFLFFTIIASTTCLGDQFPLSDTEFLDYKLPPEFEFKTSRDPDDQFRFAINFSHFGQNRSRDLGAKVFLFKLNRDDMQSIRTDQQKREFLAIDCEYFAKGSVEKETTIKTFKGESDVFYCSFTDETLVHQEQLLPGEFRHVSMALVINDDFEFLARVFSNSVENKAFEDFLGIMASLGVTNQ